MPEQDLVETIFVVVQEYAEQPSAIWAYRVSHTEELRATAHTLFQEAYQACVSALGSPNTADDYEIAGWSVVRVIEQELALFHDQLYARGLTFMGQADHVVAVDNEDGQV